MCPLSGQLFQDVMQPVAELCWGAPGLSLGGLFLDWGHFVRLQTPQSPSLSPLEISSLSRTENGLPFKWKKKMTGKPKLWFTYLQFTIKNVLK